MKTLEEIANQVAIENGLRDWQQVKSLEFEEKETLKGLVLNAYIEMVSVKALDELQEFFKEDYINQEKYLYEKHVSQMKID